MSWTEQLQIKSLWVLPETAVKYGTENWTQLGLSHSVKRKVNTTNSADRYGGFYLIGPRTQRSLLPLLSVLSDWTTDCCWKSANWQLRKWLALVDLYNWVEAQWLAPPWSIDPLFSLASEPQTAELPGNENFARCFRHVFSRVAAFLFSLWNFFPRAKRGSFPVQSARIKLNRY